VRRLRQPLLRLLVSLTALMVVVAGMPHVVCACAVPQTGRAQKEVPARSGCGCCCCPTEPAPDNSEEAPEDSRDDGEAPKCCCQRTAKATSNSSTADGKLEAAHCVKDVTRGADLAASSAPTAVDEDITSASLALPALPCQPPVANTAQGRFVWQISLLPPPTERFLVLLHLVI
jgi:hypothetical protein